MSLGNPAAERPELTTAEDGSATLVMRRLLHHPPERVWEAITAPGPIQNWFMSEARFEHFAGGKFELALGRERTPTSGTVLTWDPPRRFEYEWIIPQGPTTPTGEHAHVRWELTPSVDGTLLTVTHRRLTRLTGERFSHGLGGLLERLAALLDGRPMPAWPPEVRSSAPP